MVAHRPAILFAVLGEAAAEPHDADTLADREAPEALAVCEAATEA
jgi:hypothetical protein